MLLCASAAEFAHGARGRACAGKEEDALQLGAEYLAKSIVSAAEGALLVG